MTKTLVPIKDRAAGTINFRYVTNRSATAQKSDSGMSWASCNKASKPKPVTWLTYWNKYYGQKAEQTPQQNPFLILSPINPTQGLTYLHALTDKNTTKTESVSKPKGASMTTFKKPCGGANKNTSFELR